MEHTRAAFLQAWEWKARPLPVIYAARVNLEAKYWHFELRHDNVPFLSRNHPFGIQLYHEISFQ